MSKSDDNNDFPDRPSFLGGGSAEKFQTSGQNPNLDEQRYALHVDPGFNDQSEYSQVGGKRNTNQPYPPSGQQNQDLNQGGQPPYGQSPYDNQNAYPSPDGQSYNQPYGDQYGQSGQNYSGEAGYQQEYDQNQYGTQPGGQEQYGGYGQDYSAYGNTDYSNSDYANAGYQQGYDQSYAYPDANNPNAGYGEQGDVGDTSFLHNEYPDEEFPQQPARKSKLPKRLAGVALLVVIGAGLGYAYKTGMFPMGTNSRVAGDGPVFIPRDSSPIKERPSEPGGKTFPEGKKAIYGRLEGDDNNASKSQERLESREEKVIETSNSNQDNSSVPGITVGSTPPPAQNRGQESGGDGVQTVKTFQVRPDGSIVNNNVPGISVGGFPTAPKQNNRIGITSHAFNAGNDSSQDSSNTQASRERSDNNIGSGIQPIRAKSRDRIPPAPQVTERSEPDQRIASLPQRQQRPEPAPVRPEPVSPPQQNIGGGIGYAIQVAARRDEGDALAAFADIQQKYPNVLSSYGPLIQRADLTAQGKGVWYRLRIGPMDSKSAASDVCQQLKSRGHGACFVSKL